MQPLIGVTAEGPGVGVADETRPDPESFAEFYVAEYRGVLAFAASLCRDLHAAEDLTQDAFFAAQRRWDTISRFDRPDRWVRRAVANRSVSRWRRLMNDERRVRKLAQLRAPEPGTRADDLDVWQLVRRLPARQAQVIALTYLEDRSIADVAEVLGISAESAKTHLQRGRAALARVIAPEDDVEDQT